MFEELTHWLVQSLCCFKGYMNIFNEVLEADLANLDETDSGLDIDALQDVVKAVNGLLTQKNSILMITHYRNQKTQIR
ncbi:hypothetical protein ZOSMA_45G00790 [Zostera marina]|uniref:Uncharacterized protein n=1 Tax=Zostera marina TaxID=29655 RepID=A0A0K9P0M4_ZOSMR|nr:hypothetical protein ZOSMA_45G00790 [Zostera marina]